MGAIARVLFDGSGSMLGTSWFKQYLLVQYWFGFIRVQIYSMFILMCKIYRDD